MVWLVSGAAKRDDGAVDARRAVGIPTSLTVLIALPFLVTAPEPKAPAPLKAAVMLETAGSSPEFVRLQAPGSFGAPAYLASEDGSEGATVAKVAKENCRGAPIRPAGVDMDAGIICLRISGLPDHGEVAGEVEVGTGTALTLTVKRRAEFFWGLPAGVLGAGLLLGLLVTLVPAWLAAGIRRLRLEWLLWVNDNHSVAEQIAGARAWADDRIVDGKSAEEVRDPRPCYRDGVRRRGPAQPARQGTRQGEARRGPPVRRARPGRRCALGSSRQPLHRCAAASKQLHRGCGHDREREAAESARR